MKKFLVLLFLFPLISFARAPLASELQSFVVRDPTVDTWTVLRATSTNPFFITGQSFYGNSQIRLSCDGVEFWNSGSSSGSPFKSDFFPQTVIRCAGAVLINPNGAVNYSLFGYSMSDSDFDEQGGGGGGGSVDFTSLNLQNGIFMLMVGFIFVVWYFKPRKT